MIETIPMEDYHLPFLWEILRDYPDYFHDEFGINSFKTFSIYMLTKAIDPRIGLKRNGKEKEIVACAYLESVKEFACLAFFTKKNAFKPAETVELCKSKLDFYFGKYRVPMLYAVTRTNNTACRKLLKNIGFTETQTLKKYRTVKGKATDYVLASILKGG